MQHVAEEKRKGYSCIVRPLSFQDYFVFINFILTAGYNIATFSVVLECQQINPCYYKPH
jgi:hypothetical protein